jgi:Lrp/AsnC family transcriptional regulator
MALELDRADIRILDALQQNAALSASELAERCSLTTTTAWRRLQRLEKAGAIKGRVALLDRKAVGLNVLVFAQVKLATTGRESLARFEQAVQRHPQVLDCYSLLGDKDFLLRIVVPSIEAYEAFFLDHLSHCRLSKNRPHCQSPFESLVALSREPRHQAVGIQLEVAVQQLVDLRFCQLATMRAESL